MLITVIKVKVICVDYCDKRLRLSVLSTVI